MCHFPPHLRNATVLPSYVWKLFNYMKIMNSAPYFQIFPMLTMFTYQ